MDAECETCGSIFRGVDRSEDGEPEIPGHECADEFCRAWICPAECQELSFSCDGCSRVFCESHQINFQGLRLCTACLQEALERNEPECECVPSGAPDQFDARRCDFHNASSDYNVLLRRVTDIQRYDDAAGSITPSAEAQPNS